MLGVTAKVVDMPHHCKYSNIPYAIRIMLEVDNM